MVSPATRLVLVFVASLTLAACSATGAYYESDERPRLGPPIFSWDALASCQVPPPSTENTQARPVEVGATRLRLGVPEGWVQDTPSVAAADDTPRSWSDPANEAWLGVGQLELDASIPARDARPYISNKHLHADGDTIVQLCGPCLEITNRCKATIGGRLALVTEGNFMGRTAQVTVLWPQATNRWLAIGAGAIDSTTLPELRARVRRVEFK